MTTTATTVITPVQYLQHSQLVIAKVHLINASGCWP